MIAGTPAENRKSARLRLAKPRLDELATWLDAQLQKIPGKNDLVCWLVASAASRLSNEPEAYLRDVITRIGSHPINRLDELLPWNWSQPATRLSKAQRRDSVAA